MVEPIMLTDQPIRMTATGRQERYLAIDVGHFRGLDLQLLVTAMEGTNPIATVKLIGAMDTDADTEGWSDVGVFAPVSAGSTTRVCTLEQGFFRFLRWELSSLTGTSPVVTFMIWGRGHRD